MQRSYRKFCGRFIPRLQSQHRSKLSYSVSSYTKFRSYQFNQAKHSIYPLIFALPLPMLIASDEKEQDIQTEQSAASNSSTAAKSGANPAQPGFSREYIAGGIFVGFVLSMIYLFVNANRLTEEEKAILLSLEQNKRVSEILLLGKAGVGKSYLVNALIGQDLTEEKDDETGTFEAKRFPFYVQFKDYNIATLNIWDTVGLFSEQSDDECVKELRKAEKSGAIILAIDGNTARLYDDLSRLAQVLNKLYGGNSWISRTVVVVTQCNEYVWKKGSKKLEKRKKNWSDKIPQELMKAKLSEKDAKSIPIVWAYSKYDKEWKHHLINTLVRRANADNKDAIAMIDPNVVDENTWNSLSKQVKDLFQTVFKKGREITTTHEKGSSWWGIFTWERKTTVQRGYYENPFLG